MQSFEDKLANSLRFDETDSNEDRLKKCIDQLFQNPLIVEDTRSTNNAVMFIAMARSAKSRKNFEAAVNFYTKGLQEVFPHCELSAILYSNRSEVLGFCKKYYESLIDIHRAIEISANTALANHFKDRMMSFKETYSRATEVETYGFKDIPPVSQGEHKDIGGMSNAVRLVYSTKYGIYFEATKLIGTGDVILVEKPQVTSIFQPDVAVANMCHYCLKRYSALLPCERCNSALYCSKECRAKAYEEYHRIVCNSKNFPDDVQFVLNLLMKITENGQKLTEAIKYCEQLDKMEADSVKEFYTKRDNLENNLKSVLILSISMKKNDEKNAKYILKSAYIASYLRNQTNYLREYDDILSIAKLLLRLFYIFHTHVFRDYISDDKAGTSGAYTLYSLLSLVHYSRYANTVHSLHKNGVISLHASTDIHPGEQITFNFQPENSSANLVVNVISRQIILQKEEKRTLCNCSSCPYCYISKTQKVLERCLRKKRLDIDSSWDLTTREADRV